jgi:hypothetical protein
VSGGTKQGKEETRKKSRGKRGKNEREEDEEKRRGPVGVFLPACWADPFRKRSNPGVRASNVRSAEGSQTGSGHAFQGAA